MTTKASSNGVTESAAPADWTIMLYIEADDTLANFAVESLKQLNKSASAPPDGSDKASVLVAAHFAFPFDISKPSSPSGEGPGSDTVHDYIFKADGRHLDPTQVRPLPTPLKTSARPRMLKSATGPGMAKEPEKEALKDFLKMVSEKPEYKAKHYALILWGHGPELLFQAPDANAQRDRNSLYLNPVQLGEALGAFKPPEGSSLDIVGFDACSMSMFEMAYELKGLAKYMIASQDDVPDLSFPYDNLIHLFRKCGNDPDLKPLLEKGVEAYVSTYKDCICNMNTEMRPVTLSVLDLNNSDALKDAVSVFACALLNAKDKPGLKGQPSLADLLIEARKYSQDYAGGLYVDLHDFCTKLEGQLDNTSQEYKENIRSACKGVSDALTKATSNFIVSNSNDKHGHGISIYLPYITVEREATVNKPLVKGGDLLHGAKGYSEMLNGAAAEYLMCARRDLILDTESYYRRLQLAEDTHWYDFIAKQWTRALIEKAPADLDYHYSAQQSWMNAIPAPADTATLCSPQQSAKPEPEMVAMK